MTNRIVQPEAPGMKEVLTHLQARTSLIYVVTHEERRFLEDLKNLVTDQLNIDLYTWSITQGIIKYTDRMSKYRADGEFQETINNPLKGLDKFLTISAGQDRNGTVLVAKDFHTVMNEPVPRAVRDSLERMESTQRSMIITAPELGFSGGRRGGLPMTLEKDMVVIHYDLLNRDQIINIFEGQIDSQKQKKGKKSKLKSDYSKEDLQVLASACQGMTQAEISTAMASSLVRYKEYKYEHLLNLKKQILRKSEILEYVESGYTLEDIGGLDEAKEYFTRYKEAFSDEAKEFGVTPISGALLTGVPGTGKSLLAKTVSHIWQLPCLRLDVGKVMTGLVGGSEERMRQAIKTAEAMAPCVLWIDEVEKGMSGVKSSNFSDAGTMSRVFGTFLTWMQEKTVDVVVIATANDITAVPPEFIRRFNEVFFVDLPVPEEREEIFKIHLNHAKRDPKKFDMNRLVTATHDYTGAEIEKCVKEGIVHAFYDKAKDVTTKHIIGAVSQTKPIAKIMADQIANIREWARNRARYASTEAAMPGAQKVATASGKVLDLDESLDDFDNVKTENKKLKDISKSKRTDDIITD
jgi:ATP-dependent 26S proteasome regulatory subunit